MTGKGPFAALSQNPLTNGRESVGDYDSADATRPRAAAAAVIPTVPECGR